MGRPSNGRRIPPAACSPRAWVRAAGSACSSPNGIEWIIWWLAVSRIGALAVPLSTLYAPAELAKVVRLADIGLLVAPSRVLDIDVVERFEAAFPELAGQTTNRLRFVAAPYLRRVVVTDWTRTGHG